MSNFSVAQGTRSRGIPAYTGTGLILAAGLIHLALTPEHLEEATYIGLLFAADFVGSVVAALGLIRGRWWGWVLGALVAGGAFVAYVLDGLVGLPGMEAEGLLSPVGVLTKTLEALFLVLCAFELATGFGRKALAIGVAAVLATAMLATALIVLGATPASQNDHESSPSQQQHNE